MKQLVELLQNENNRLRMESESLLKVIELLSVKLINTREINDNTENLITLNETGKYKKTKLNHQQDYRIPLRRFHLELFPSKNTSTNLNLLMRTTQFYLHVIMLPVKEDRKSSQLNITNNQRLRLLTNNMKNPLNRGKHV